MEIIVLPNQLLNPVYVSGLSQPLNEVADALDEQDKHEFALALRDAITICETFVKVNIMESHTLYKN